MSRMVGRFQLLERRGQGGQATVWKAEDTIRRTIVALKLFEGPILATSGFRGRFEAEARSAGSLSHPGTAESTEAQVHDDHAYIVFRYVEGRSLSDVIADGPLDPARALGFAREIALALAHAHSRPRRVLHRDVKPANLIVTQDDHVVLVDFGIAIEEGGPRFTTTGQIVGTLGYIAPELLRGGTASERSDLYGLGVVLFEMLTGRRPFGGESSEALLYQQTHVDPRRPSEFRRGLAPAVDRLVVRLLARDPAERPVAADRLAGDLESLARRARTGWLDRTELALEQFLATPLRRVLRGTRRLLALEQRPMSAATWLNTLTRAGAGAAIIVLAALGAGDALRPRVTRLAVLPVHAAGPDSLAIHHIAAGFGENLTNRLGEVKGLGVIPWITSASYDPGVRPHRDIAHALGAGALVIASISREHGRLRLRIVLVDGRDGTQRWSRTYEETDAGMFELQERAALDVAAAAGGRISAEERQRMRTAPSRSIEAYEAFLRGSDLMATGRSTDADRALAFFHRAVELDPSLAEARVGIGSVHTDRYFRGREGGASNLSIAEEQFLRALAIKPGLAVARRGLIRVYFLRGDPVDRPLAIAQAAAQGANDRVEELLVAGEGYMLSGVLCDTAAVCFRRVLDLDPANQAAAWFLPIACVWAGQHERGIESGRLYTERYGEDGEIELWVGLAHASLGRANEASQHLLRSVEVAGGTESNAYIYAYVVCFLLAEGRRSEARELYEEARQILHGALDRSPDHVRIRSILAMLHGLMHEWAEFDRESALILAQSRALGFYGEGICAIAMCELERGRPERAGPLFEAAIRTKSPDLFNVALVQGAYGMWPGQDAFRASPYASRAAALIETLRTRYSTNRGVFSTDVIRGPAVDLDVRFAEVHPFRIPPPSTDRVRSLQ